VTGPRCARFGAGWRGLWLACLVLATGTGCETARYYGQAIRGHFEIAGHSRDIPEVRADPATPPVLRSELELVLQLRDFAETNLSLPVDGHYLKYADIGRRYVVWNVHAAPEFSLEPETWWYPFVGRLEYRGYFREADAMAQARRLEREGRDVFVGGVTAYSTLGWFRDPVLNTWVHDPPAEVADLLFHELAHQRVFIAGDTDFDEAFATTVAEEGVRRWLHSTGDSRGLARHETAMARRAAFVALVSRARERLEIVYDSPAGRRVNEDPRHVFQDDVAQLRAAKEAVLVQLRADYALLKASWGGAGDFDGWFRQPLNNAHLNDVDAYYALVPGFRRLLDACGGSLPAFYESVDQMRHLSKEGRRRRLAAGS
jgi:predicted aminopeptidase